VSGATGEESAAAIVQLSQALGAGALRGEEFNSINEQAPRIMQGIADSMGVTRGELKNLAAQGSLTTSVVIKAIQDMSASVDSEFSKMNATFGQKGTVALNNLTKGFGQNNDVRAAIAVIGDAMVGLTENLPALINGIESLAVAFTAKLVAGMYSSAAASLQQSAANRALSASSAEAASSALANATAEVNRANAAKFSAVTSVGLAEAKLAEAKASGVENSAEVQLALSNEHSIRIRMEQIAAEKALEIQRLKSQITTTGMVKTSTRMAEVRQAEVALARELAAAELETAAARTVATDREIAITAELAAAKAALRAQSLAVVEATIIETAAREASIVATRAASVATTVLNGAMSLLGGPAGIAMIAAGALYYYVSASNEAKKANEDFAASINTTISSLREMSNVQLDAAKFRLSDAIDSQTEAMNKQQKAVDDLKSKLSSYAGVPVDQLHEGTTAFSQMTQVQHDLAIETESLEQKQNTLSQTKSKLFAVLQSLNGAVRSNAVELQNDGNQAGFAAKMNSDLNAILGIQQKLKGAPSVQISDKKPDSKAFKERQQELIALQKQEDNYGTAKAARAAEDEKSRQAGITDPAEISRLGDIAVKNFEIAAARKEATKESKASASAAKKDETAQQQVTDKMSDTASKASQLGIEYNNLKKGIDENSASTSRFTLESATLEAQRQLGAAATEKQIDAQARNILKIHEETAAIDKLKKKQAEDVQTTQKFETVESKTGTKGAGVDAQYADDLKALNNYHKMAGASDARYQKTKSKLEEKYRKDKQAAAIEDYKAQSEWNTFLMDGLDALGQSATTTIAGLASGTMSATEAMQNFANIILNQAVGALVSMGIEAIKNQMVGQAAAATSIATASATGAAISSAYATPAFLANTATMGGASATGLASLQAGVASSQMLALAGARQFGGGTNAGSVYRLGENNTPEVWKTSAGMFGVAGDGGNVTPLKDLGGSGGFSQQVNITNAAGANVSTNSSADGKQLNIMIDQRVSKAISEKRGRIYSAFNRTTNLQSRAR